MVSKPTEKDQTDAVLNMQKGLLDAYEEASRFWFARMKSEVDLWSDLATKLSATRSVPDALAAYQETVTERVRMAAEDGQKLIDECREITGIVTRSFSNGRPTAST